MFDGTSHNGDGCHGCIAKKRHVTVTEVPNTRSKITNYPGGYQGQSFHTISHEFESD